jgi:DNA-binding HxlR family transcriptional regulator
MARKPRPDLYYCEVATTLEVIGGRWKAVLLFHLIDSTKRFGELRRTLPSATVRMITLQLRELERDGIVRRTVYAKVPPKVEYSLTEFGRTLIPVLVAMRDWGRAERATVVAKRQMQDASPAPFHGPHLSTVIPCVNEASRGV